MRIEQTHSERVPEAVAVEVGEAVGVALPELLRVTVAVGLLEAVPLKDGVLVAVLVMEPESTKKKHRCIYTRRHLRRATAHAMPLYCKGVFCFCCFLPASIMAFLKELMPPS